jgi:hypothetical protein
MTSLIAPSTEFVDLMCHLTEGRISPQQASRLNELLCADPANSQHYVDFMLVVTGLRWMAGDGSPEGGMCRVGNGEPLECGQQVPNRPHSILSYDVNPTVCDLQPSPRFTFLSTAIHGTVGYFSSGWPVAYLIATVVVGLGMLIGSWLPAFYPQQIAKRSSLPSRVAPELATELVGRITGMVDCKWSDVSAGAFNGEQVPLGRKYALASGLLEITYDTGAKVILQGPVSFDVETRNGGFLSIGKLTGKVEAKQARGLSVRTPSATVTDLGTEFGVEVDTQDGTTSHVFRGSVRVQVVAADGRAEGHGRVLRENESARVQSGTERKIVIVHAPKPSHFVREIPKRKINVFDLVDVVAGGDGFSGRRNRGIDTKGRVIGWAMPHEGPPGTFPVSDGRYHRVDAIRFIDGVFVPDSRSGPVQVDSTGRTFGDFVTSSNQVGRYIWAGGPMPREDFAVVMGDLVTLLGDVDYASPGHGYLLLSCNNGITFDLEAIRKADPNYTLLRFRAVAGNTSPESRDVNSTMLGLTDMRVLVDGAECFKRREINGCSGMFQVIVPIRESDRFLTVLSTDSGHGILGAGVVLGDPRLEILDRRSGAAEIDDNVRHGSPEGR